MRLKSLLIATLISCISSSAIASNIYKPDTYGDKIYKAVDPFLPEGMTAILFDQDDPLPFLKEIDQEAAKNAGISPATLHHFIERIEQEQPHLKDRIAYAITGAGVPGNEPTVRFCAIVILKVDADDWAGAISHEALHCRNSQIRDTEAFSDYLKPIWKEQAQSVSWLDFTGFIDESLVAGLQVAFYAKNGATEPPHYVQIFTKSENRPGNSIGTRTANNLIARCFKSGACPTDSNEMLHMIMDDQKLRSDLIQDMTELRGSPPAQPGISST